MSILSMSPHSSSFSNTLPTTPSTTMSPLSLSRLGAQSETSPTKTANSNARSLRPRHLAGRSTAAARIRSPYARPRAPAGTRSESERVKVTSTSTIPTTPRPKSHKKKPSSILGIPAVASLHSQGKRKAILAAAAISAGGDGTPGHVGSRSGSLVRRPSSSGGAGATKGLGLQRSFPHGGMTDARGQRGMTGGYQQENGPTGIEKENSTSSDHFRIDPSSATGSGDCPQAPGQLLWVQDQDGRAFQVYQPDQAFPKQVSFVDTENGTRTDPTWPELGMQTVMMDPRQVIHRGRGEMMPMGMSAESMVQLPRDAQSWQVEPGVQHHQQRREDTADRPPTITFAIPGATLSQQQSEAPTGPRFHPQPQRRAPIAFDSTHTASADLRASLSRSSTQMVPSQVLQARRFTEHRIQPSFTSSASSRSISGSSATFPGNSTNVVGLGSSTDVAREGGRVYAPEIKLEAMQLNDPAIGSGFEKEYVKASVPFKLPTPPIPQVDAMNLGDEELSRIPLSYILASLKTLSSDLFASSALYRPSPFHACDAATQSSMHGLPNQMKWILPAESKIYAEGADFSRTMGPTHVLAVKGMKGMEIGGENKGRLMLIHHIIYAAQCSNFPRVPSSRESSRTMVSPATTQSGYSEVTVSSIILDDYAQKVGGSVLADSSSSRRSSIRSSASSGVALNDGGLQETVDLPLLHLSIPCPSLFPILHTWLYIQQPQVLLTKLLDLPRAERPCAIASRLASLGMIEILSRLKRVHGFWQNVVSLGISDKDLWKVMQTAWRLLVSALQAQEGSC